MSDCVYSLRIRIIDFLDLNENNELNLTGIVVTEDAFSDELFESFLIRLAKKYNHGNGIYWSLLNGKELTWGQYFSRKIYESIEADYLENPDDLISIPIFYLVRDFHIDQNEIQLGINVPGLGADVGRFKGIRFYIHTRESNRHHKKHIHCSYSGIEREIDLETVQFIGRPFPSRTISKTALRFIRNNQQELLNFWDTVIEKGGPIPEFKMKFDV